MPDQKKFLDAEGVKYLWSKINMQDYPNNETLMDVIEAIDETKADKSELIQSDWNQNDETALDYIKNRPFYDYEDYGEWLSFNVSTMEKSEYGDYYSMQVGRANPIGDFIFSLNVGDTIQVNWDGVIYNCQITLDDSAGCSFRQFGNLSIFNSVAENTGEPFGIMYGYNAWSTLEGYVHSYADMSNTTFLCRTYTINTRQLDEKHIPDTIARVKDIPEQVQSDWNQNDETAADYVKGRTHWESKENVLIIETGAVEVPVGPGELCGIYPIEEGCAYTVVINGESYEFTAAKYDDFFTYLGNIYLIGLGGEDTGETFVLFNPGSDEIYMAVAETGVYTAEIYKQANVAHLLDEKFIPDTITRVSDVMDMQVQPDWNQSDETALDYIKNRTHYIEEKIIFDYDLADDGHYSHEIDLEIGETYILEINGQRFEVGCAEEYGSGYKIVRVDSNQGSDINVAVWESQISSTAPCHVVLKHGYTFKQLDEEFIPDTIARVKDIPEQVQSDWNQNDENSNDFIKNRPFGESEVTRNLPKSSNIAGKIYDIEFAKLLWDNVENAIYKASHSYINTSDGLMKYYKTYSFESIRNISNTQLTIRIINNDNNQDLSVEINILTGEISMWDQNGALVYYDGYITIPGGMILKLDEKYIPNNIPKLSTASIGQTIVVKSVDENGKPTEWEAVETQSDWNQNDKTAADYIKNKPEIATDDEIISMLMELDMLPAITDSDGSMLSDENGNILLW